MIPPETSIIYLGNQIEGKEEEIEREEGERVAIGGGPPGTGGRR